MHNWAKCIMENVKEKVDDIGIDSIEGHNLCELKDWSCIAKNIAEYDYYYNVVDAMKESSGKYDEAIKEYQETKSRHMGDSPESIDAIENLVEVLESDIQALMPQMTVNEMARMRSKLTNLANMM